MNLWPPAEGHGQRIVLEPRSTRPGPLFLTQSHPPQRDCAIPPLSWCIILSTVVIRFVPLSTGNRWQVAARAYFGFLLAYMQHLTKGISYRARQAPMQNR